MYIFNTKEHYGIVTKFLHWVIAFLVLIMLIGGFLMGEAPDAWKGIIYNTHKLVGITILLLMLIRLFWLIINPKPLAASPTPRWQHILSHSIHGLLYLFVIIMPATGWVMSAAATKFPHIGNWQLMLPGIPASKALASFFDSCHLAIAWILITLITLHILAALKHTLIDRDGIFKRMWF